MEKIANRKLQKLSGSNFVSLPHVWVEENDLQKGDVVELYRENTKLIIVPRSEKA